MQTTFCGPLWQATDLTHSTSNTIPSAGACVHPCASCCARIGVGSRGFPPLRIAFVSLLV